MSVIQGFRGICVRRIRRQVFDDVERRDGLDAAEVEFVVCNLS